MWVPVDGGIEKDVDLATTRLIDPRADHHWDRSAALAKAFRSTLHLSEDAWDVYLIYAPGTHWEGASPPPAPTFWMHQLGSRAEPRAKAPYLDAHVFAKNARLLLTYPGDGSIR